MLEDCFPYYLVNPMQFRGALIAIWTLLLVAPVSADLIFNTQGNYDIGSSGYSKGDLAQYDDSVSTSTLYFDRDLITGGNTTIAAVDVISINEAIITAEGNFEIGVDSFRGGDLVTYDFSTGTASLFFDRDLITGGDQNITAVSSLDNGNFIFTTEGNFDIGTDSYSEGDLVEYDPVNNLSTLFFDRDTITSGNNKLNSAHVLSDGDLLFTTNGKTTIDTTEYEEGDVIRYDFTSGTAVLYLDRDVVTGGNKKIAALSVAVPEPNAICCLAAAAGLMALKRRRKSL